MSHNQNASVSETFVVDSHCKEPKSRNIFYFESIMFDKMLERKLINYISILMTLYFILICYVFFFLGIEIIKFGKSLLKALQL